MSVRSALGWHLVITASPDKVNVRVLLVRLATKFFRTTMSSPKKTSKELNPKSTSYEFLGPPGAAFIIFAVPITTYSLYYGCSEATGGCPPPLNSIQERVTTSLSNPDFWKSLWDTQAFLLYLGWYAFTVLAWAILPGDIVEGTPLRSGGKKKYKINGTWHIPWRLYLPHRLS